MGRSPAKLELDQLDAGSEQLQPTSINRQGMNGVNHPGKTVNGIGHFKDERELAESTNHSGTLETKQLPKTWSHPTAPSTPPDSPPRKKRKLSLDESHTLTPCYYISNLPSKDFRTALLEAFNSWLHIKPATLDTTKRAVDMLHNSSLVLDDIEDGSRLRRGMPTAHVIFGAAQSINSATFVYVNVVKLVYQMRSTEAMGALLEEIGNLFVGQGWDLYWKHHLRVPTEEEYLQMVDLKTGGLFRLVTRLMLADSPHCRKPLNVEGDINGNGGPDFCSLSCLLSRFFQIRDDYQNLQSALYVEQKGFCEDFDEGKLSYLVVHAWAQSSSYRDHVLGLFRSHSTTDVMTVEGKRYILFCLEEVGSLRATKELLGSLEDGISEEIGKLEEWFGEENPMLRLLVASLSVKHEEA